MQAECVIFHILGFDQQCTGKASCKYTHIYVCIYTAWPGLEAQGLHSQTMEHNVRLFVFNYIGDCWPHDTWFNWVVWANYFYPYMLVALFDRHSWSRESSTANPICKARLLSVGKSAQIWSKGKSWTIVSPSNALKMTQYEWKLTINIQKLTFKFAVVVACKVPRQDVNDQPL